jgi:hypothetical protein
MNKELQRMWKEVVAEQIKVLSQHSPGSYDENLEKWKYENDTKI